MIATCDDACQTHEPAADYAAYRNPAATRLLHSVRLDVAYDRAEGDDLEYVGADGRRIRVLDLVGGCGASLLGHHHPRVVEAVARSLSERRPFNAQAGVRARAGELCRRLSLLVGRSTERDYVVTLASTGAEAVDAAIKHAALERLARFQRAWQSAAPSSLERSLTPHAWSRLCREAAKYFDTSTVGDLSELRHQIDLYNDRVMQAEPLFLALEGAFHGKLSGAGQLTSSDTSEPALAHLGPQVRFLPIGDDAALQRAVRDAAVTLPAIDIERGRPRLTARSVSRIAACFAEPIQGEGGVRVVPAAFLRSLRRAADVAGFPLVLDEIQSGLGRTGEPLASQAAAVRGDYYLLGKSLGGGLVKQSALLVDRRRYQEPFGLLHTSTFADDDYSASAALAALDLLEENDAALPRRCQELGEYLLAALHRLKRRYPQQLADVRGRGLMIGVELAPQHGSPSPLLRLLSQQNQLGLFAAGYLLHEHGIRVMPTLSAPGTLRIEPSAYVAKAELARFVAALEEMVKLLRGGDVAAFSRFLIQGGETGAPQRQCENIRPAPEFNRHPSTRLAPTVDCTAKVAFLGHFLQPAALRHWEPGLGGLGDEQCRRFCASAPDLMAPFVAGRTVVRSLRAAVDLTVIGLPFTSEQAEDALRRVGRQRLVALIDQALGLASSLGCGVVGLGGYTSILTAGGREVRHRGDFQLTTGSSLTAVTALAALGQTAQRHDIPRTRLAVVGAGGDIGRTVSAVAAADVEQLLLVGRPGALRRLERLAESIYEAAWRRLLHTDDEVRQTTGIHRAIAGTRTFKRMLRESTNATEPVSLGRKLRAGLLRELGSQTPVRVADCMEEIRGFPLVVSATNSVAPVIGPDHLDGGPLVLCDVATPGDVDPAVESAHPKAVLIRGGRIHLPHRQRIEIGGMPACGEGVFACLAETILLGLSQCEAADTSPPSAAGSVLHMMELARSHGFSIAAA